MRRKNSFLKGLKLLAKGNIFRDYGQFLWLKYITEIELRQAQKIFRQSFCIQ